MKRKALDKSNRSAARPGGKEAGVKATLTNEWLDQQGVPNLQASWVAYHYPEQTTPRGGHKPLYAAEPEAKR